ARQRTAYRSPARRSTRPVTFRPRAGQAEGTVADLTRSSPTALDERAGEGLQRLADGTLRQLAEDLDGLVGGALGEPARLLERLVLAQQLHELAQRGVVAEIAVEPAQDLEAARVLLLGRPATD